MPFDKELAELEQRKNRARQMGGPEKIARKHAQGRLTAREWLDRLLDPGTFREIGILNHSDMPGMEEKTPADSKIGGFGKIDGRHVAICANDFTVLAASTSRVAMRKEGDVRLVSERRGIPFIYHPEVIRDGLLEHVRHRVRRRFPGRLAYCGDQLHRSRSGRQRRLRRET